LDIVNLRSINDRAGYEVGDDVLRAVADALTETRRKSDLVARCGGDEFAVLLLDANPGAVEMIIGRVRRRLDDLVRRRDLPGPVVCAFGLAPAEVLPETPDDLLLAADSDMQSR